MLLRAWLVPPDTGVMAAPEGRRLASLKLVVDEMARAGSNARTKDAAHVAHVLGKAQHGNAAQL